MYMLEVYKVCNSLVYTVSLFVEASADSPIALFDYHRLEVTIYVLFQTICPDMKTRFALPQSYFMDDDNLCPIYSSDTR